MKIVVIGGTGLIGSKVVQNLRDQNHQVVAASPATGINTITGEGLAEALKNTDIVIDLANSPSFEDEAVMNFFKTAGNNLLTAEINAGVKHHVALSIVGVEEMQNIGYMRAKKVQEDLITQSGIPYTIVRSTQFMEFIKGIADQATQGDEVHLSSVSFQPIAAVDVANYLTEFALGNPLNDRVQIAGPKRYPMYEIVQQYLSIMRDSRKVTPTGEPVYFGGTVTHEALVPVGQAKFGRISFDQWVEDQKSRN